MSEKDIRQVLPIDDDVTSFPADDARLNSYRNASAQLANFDVPRLVDANNPNERLYIAAFDGTGNDANNDALVKTNVAHIRDQIKISHKLRPQVFLNYLEGPGTQDNFFARAVDGASGHTYGDRLEEMYADLVRRTNRWHIENPDTQVRVASIGFSRGGSQAAGFTNLLNERGIPDLASRRVHADGSISYERHLAPPGKTLQAVGLFDPVATGIPETFDRRLPPSVISGFQITALDEHRGAFPSDRILPLGRSDDGRFLNCSVAGCHSNIGGGYIRDGLSSRSHNLMVDYLNALRPGAPLLEKVYEPTDPRLNVVHNSREGTWPLYQFDRTVDRTTPEGINTRLTPDPPMIPSQAITVESLPHGPRPLLQPHGLPTAPATIGAVPQDDGRSALLSRQIAAAEAAGLSPLPGHVRMANMVAQGAGIATGAGMTALDAHQTHQRATALLEAGNQRGATSEYQHALARNVGGWAGGAGTALALGGSGALPFVAGAASAVVLSAGFEKAVELKENRSIFQQVDSDGIHWKYNGSYWERPGLIEAGPTDSPTERGVAASYEKSLELNARANAVAVDFALAKPTQLLAPFNIPAKPEEKRGLDNQNWTRNPAGDGWERQVRDMSPHSERSVYRTETAPPERARELDAEAVERVRYNVANGQAAIAMTYMESHAANRAGDVVAVPASVRNALPQPDAVTAHNGLTYRQDANGAWSDGQNVASGNLALELEMTRQARQPVVEAFDLRLAQLQAQPAPTLAETQSNEMLYRYRLTGNELKPDWQQAIQAATEKTKAEAGIEGPTSQKLLPNDTGKFTADSPIAHLQTGADGIMRQVALTTTEDINSALNQAKHAQQGNINTLAQVNAVAPNRSEDERGPEVRQRAATPDTPTHPDYALLQQIRDGVKSEDEKAGRSYDDRSERLSRSLLAACKDNRDAYPNCSDYSLAANAITRADHIAVGKGHMFVVQGQPGDPASLRAHVNVSDAMSTPIALSDAKLDAANDSIHQERERAQQLDSERIRTQESAARQL